MCARIYLYVRVCACAFQCMPVCACLYACIFLCECDGELAPVITVRSW